MLVKFLFQWYPHAHPVVVGDVAALKEGED